MIDPLVVRAELPTPDAVIVRHADGKITIFADVRLPEQRVAELLHDADHLEGGGLALG